MDKAISLYLIGGFLGAGKTTFLRRLLPQLPRDRLGLIVNEFGSVGIDSALLRGGDVKLVEINNGSIFCACLKDGFVRTLKAMSEQPIDCLFIEASGMADPASMPSVIRRLSPYLERTYDYRGLVCLVDCTTFLIYAELLLPLQNQVRTADLILLNKIDLASAEQVRAVRRQIRMWNREAVVYETDHADVPPELLEQELCTHGLEGVSSNTVWNRPAVYTLRLRPLDANILRFNEFYRRIEPKVLRIKGFVKARDGVFHVDGVCTQLELTLCSDDAVNGTLVVIGRSGKPFEKEIRRAWEVCFTEPLQVEAT